jgi:hypothetical protein
MEEGKIRIFQVKYNNGNYAYYKGLNPADVNENTKTYHSYIDAMDEINQMIGYEHIKLRNALIEFYEKK